MSDKFEDHCWRDIVSPDVLEIYSHYHRRTFVGPAPALLAIDLYELAYEGGAKPVIDLVRTYPSSCGEHAWAAIEPTQRLFAAARAAGLPVFYTTMDTRSDSLPRLVSATKRQRLPVNPELYAIKSEFASLPGDVVITKQRASAFFGTPLTAHLNQLGIRTLVICGESTSGCVRASAVDAYSHGFHVVVVEECCYDRSPLRIRSTCSICTISMPMCCMWPMSSPTSTASKRARRADMKPQPYGPFPYSPIIHRPRLTWPNGAQLALWVIPNVEFFSLMEKVPAAAGGGPGPIPDVPTWSVRDYGNRVGIFRLMEVLDRHGIRATVALNSELCAQHPAIIEEGRKRRWEWMGHNESNTRRLNEVPPDEEPRVIRNALATIEKATGTRPVGWLGSGLQETWNTVELLAAEGCEYVADWVNDDQPYIMTLDGGRRLISMPYSHEINDKPAFERHNRTSDEFRNMICRQFDVLYREGAQSGRVLAIAIHPYLTGVPHRIDAFNSALQYICSHTKVWRATGAEIARHYAAQLDGTGKAAQ